MCTVGSIGFVVRLSVLVGLESKLLPPVREEFNL